MISPAAIIPHEGKERTGREMARIVRQYPFDLYPYRGETLLEFFGRVRRIPYRDDAMIFSPLYGVKELLDRPRELMDRRKYPALDCKKKAILIASHAEMMKMPWRLVAVREKGFDRFHHVFPQIQIAGIWENADATLNHYTLGMSKPEVIEAEVIS